LVSIQLVSPASGEGDEDGYLREIHLISIQLVSPASGEGDEDGYLREIHLISIQLVSPASGEQPEIQQRPAFSVFGTKFPFN